MVSGCAGCVGALRSPSSPTPSPEWNNSLSLFSEGAPLHYAAPLSSLRRRLQRAAQLGRAGLRPCLGRGAPAGIRSRAGGCL